MLSMLMNKKPKSLIKLIEGRLKHYIKLYRSQIYKNKKWSQLKQNHTSKKCFISPASINTSVFSFSFDESSRHKFVSDKEKVSNKIQPNKADHNNLKTDLKNKKDRNAVSNRNLPRIPSQIKVRVTTT